MGGIAGVISASEQRPLVEMLAAGNRVIVKSSDFTPACGELLSEMIAPRFARRAF